MVNEIFLFNDGSEAIQCIKENDKCLDILFLDILMKDMGGIETASLLRRMKSKVVIIFLTSSEEYMFDTMEVKPLAYLMKDQLTTDESYTRELKLAFTEYMINQI